MVLAIWLDINFFCYVSYFTGPPALTVNILKNTEKLSVFLHWDEVDDVAVATYVVTWTSERDHIKNSPSLVGLTSYTITGLTLNTVYTITVTALNKCGTGSDYRTSVQLLANTNPSIVITSAITSFSIPTATNIITYPKSTVNPADTATTDESSKFTSNIICYNKYS